ncbi:mannosyl-3-phosphoglycerate phosphatase-related protein [Dickeya oryzae]|uniref:Mannosyl-3-phosphoglycerate phosphatase-related protein n=1 Tax=Dickeya oryzae TaxID=1240404 RepID=A0AB39ILH2_9GAMM|nr:mannosyl-3-phosphoglycerate phosphatase-related protein [Dickeya oryzae]MCA6995939.1 mannosyl-3-phosphoglycerate phosphatase-related protein [Dickeya oryzae]
MPELTTNWVIFTDLDGSLLDHDTYSWDAAKPWLSRLQRHQVPVVITTSKTAAEIMPLQQELGLSYMPAIAENGAHILLPLCWQTPPLSTRSMHSLTYPDLCRELQRLREQHGFHFRGFADMDNATVAAETGLTLSQAALARQRYASEPILWQDDATSLETFKTCLAKKQLCLTQGGRFLHVMPDGISKGIAVQRLIKQMQTVSRQSLVTLGLGDGPNDISLLEETDYAVIIKGHHSYNVTLSQKNHKEVYRTQAAGPAGWNEGLTYFLSRYGAELLD